MAATYLAVVKAEYAYEATNDEELTIEEDAVFYVLEDDDPDWWKVRAKSSPSEGQSPADAPTGLVPASYLLPLPPLKQVTAIYEYTATSEEEITIQEEATYHLYEDDGDWSLVGARGKKEVGYAPSAYLEESSGGAATNGAVASAGMDRMSSGNAGDVKTYHVTEVDSDNNKRKGTLLVGNGMIIFASESDKSAMAQHAISAITGVHAEGKQLYLTFGGEQLQFGTASRGDLDEIIEKIESAGGPGVSSSGAAPSAVPAGAAGVPPAPPPPPPPPGAANVAMYIPPPPPIRRATSSASSATPSAASVPAPPPPPPAASAFSSGPSSGGKRAIAAYDFTAAGSDEISMTEGEELTVIDDSSDDWWKVRNARGEEGEVPATYVEVEEGGAGAAAGGADNDEDAARRMEEEEKAERRKDKERKRIRDLENQARGMPPNLTLPPPQRKSAASPAVVDRSTAAASPVSPPPISPPGPPIQPIAVPTGDQNRHRETREERHERHRREKAAAAAAANGHAPPVEKSKPSPARVRRWRDKTGAFEVDAEFIGLSGSSGEKIRLHKLNGVVIEVPMDKMSTDDIRFLEHQTGRRLRTDNKDRDSRRKSSADPGSKGDRDRDRAAAAAREAEREKEAQRQQEKERSKSKSMPSTSAAGKRVSMAQNGAKKSETDWFDFFLKAGCEVDDCSRYASNFERDRIDESILPDLETGTLRSLGMREGDIIRVSKYIKGRTGGGGGSGGSSSSASRPPPPPDKDEQMKSDEELARKMQEEENKGRDGSGLLTNASGGVKNTRRGRPTPSRSNPSNVSFDTITSSLEKDRSTPEISRTRSPDTVREASRRSSSTQPVASGFDDDAWTVKPSSKPATPAPAPLIDTSDSASTVDSHTKLRDLTSSPAAMPATSNQPSNAQALTDAYLESIGLGKRPASASVGSANRQTASPAPPQIQAPPPQQPQALSGPHQQFQASSSPAMGISDQQTGYYGQSNGPRPPPAPIPLNQQLLNPLIPTQTGLSGYIPTRNQASPMGGMGMMPQQTGFQQPMQTGFQQPMQTGFQQPMQTGFQQQQPMQTGFQQPMQTGFGAQPYQQSLSPQPQFGMQGTGMMQPQQTGFPTQQMGQMSIQPTGSPFQQQQQQPQQSPSSSSSADYQPSSIFAQMKTGQFAKPDSSSQDQQKYDALRPQQTGFQGFGPQQPMNMGGGMQPLQAQPTGFAPGGYMPPQQMYPQQTGYPAYRQY